ncbi:unnamed protein product [Zymoseptoria tritici ST99CH_1A5]|uniref:DUF3074 domain-containing protein n=1 Tax=Zymoseptoria tritici ST99CH_1A5 TaxID=1276529 RepID=A0A1Y6LIK3_ZYMTR|nr:unnamed protein product [Zymoseptoria tritici ST99CH_1A5]
MSDDTPAPPEFLLGPIIRLRELKVPQLPEHDTLKQYQQKAPVELQRFVTDALTEGHTFIKEYLARKATVVTQNKASPPSTEPVEVRYHKVHVGLLEAKPVFGVPTPGSTGSGRIDHASENWFGRISAHENAAKEGTASWQEFYDGLKANHNLHEVDYTPDCINAHKVLDWKAQLATHQNKIGDWEDVTMEVWQMTHKMPVTVLNKRLFTVLVITASKPNKEFITLQIPADSAMHKQVPTALDPNKVGTKGIYVSVEWCQLVDDGKKVMWQMYTASDAGGVLPMFAQKMAMPNAVAQDVGLVMDWTEKKRKGTAQVSVE